MMLTRTLEILLFFYICSWEISIEYYLLPAAYLPTCICLLPMPWDGPMQRPMCEGRGAAAPKASAFAMCPGLETPPLHRYTN